jgi:hypothetical protein
VPVGGTEAGQSLGLSGWVAALTGGVARMTVNGERIREVATVEVAEQNGGKLDGGCRPAMTRGVSGDREQARSFGVQPRAGEVRIG